jgi:hypothetical protein
MVRFHDKTGNEVWVNPAHVGIVWGHPDVNFCYVQGSDFGDGCVEVIGSPEDTVARLARGTIEATR